MIEVQAPGRVDGHYNSWPKVFLAGSIEMDKAERWQERIVKALEEHSVVVLNPRRANWDSSWTVNDPRFTEQVNWELDNLEDADIIVFYFDPNTKSPVTMLELGMFSNAQALGQEILVCCPDGFWRKGNVEIVCDRNRVPFFDTFDEMVSELKNVIAYVELPPA